MNLLNRIKYKLLGLLIDDICRKSNCKDCAFDRTEGLPNGYTKTSCTADDADNQARKVWDIR